MIALGDMTLDVLDPLVDLCHRRIKVQSRVSRSREDLGGRVRTGKSSGGEWNCVMGHGFKLCWALVICDYDYIRIVLQIPR